MYTVEQVTDTVIDRCRRHGIELTNLKLQKLLYYVQAWYLARFGSPLFQEEVEAWVHGPVVPSVFHRFKFFRWQPIEVAVSPISDGSVEEHVEAVLKSYGKFSAIQLERLTHAEPPWMDARAGLEPDEPSRNVIPKPAMVEFYRPRLNAS